MHTLAESFLYLFARDDGANRKTAAEPFREGHDVRFDVAVAEALIREKLSGSSDAGLHLVEDQEDILLVAELPERLHVVVLERQNSALSLYRLRYDSADILRHRALKSVRVVRRDVPEPFSEREEVVVEHVLSGRREGRHRSAVEGVRERDYRRPSLSVFVKRVLSRDLYRTLVGLRAGVAEEDLCETGELYQLLSDLRRRLAVEVVRHMLDLVELSLDRFYPLLVTPAERVHADSACEIDISEPVRVGHRRVLSLHGNDRETSVGRHYVLVVK